MSNKKVVAFLLFSCIFFSFLGEFSIFFSFLRSHKVFKKSESILVKRHYIQSYILIASYTL